MFYTVNTWAGEPAAPGLPLVGVVDPPRELALKSDVCVQKRQAITLRGSKYLFVRSAILVAFCIAFLMIFRCYSLIAGGRGGADERRLSSRDETVCLSMDNGSNGPGSSARKEPAVDDGELETSFGNFGGEHESSGEALEQEEQTHSLQTGNDSSRDTNENELERAPGVHAGEGNRPSAKWIDISLWVASFIIMIGILTYTIWSWSTLGDMIRTDASNVTGAGQVGNDTANSTHCTTYFPGGNASSSGTSMTPFGSGGATEEGAFTNSNTTVPLTTSYTADGNASSSASPTAPGDLGNITLFQQNNQTYNSSVP